MVSIRETNKFKWRRLTFPFVRSTERGPRTGCRFWSPWWPISAPSCTCERSTASRWSRCCGDAGQTWTLMNRDAWRARNAPEMAGKIFKMADLTWRRPWARMFYQSLVSCSNISNVLAAFWARWWSSPSDLRFWSIKEADLRPEVRLASAWSSQVLPASFPGTGLLEEVRST